MLDEEFGRHLRRRARLGAGVGLLVGLGAGCGLTTGAGGGPALAVVVALVLGAGTAVLGYLLARITAIG
ncbi:hypothetical protein AB0J86_29945 [Micromonospora sp. NPDC049559]|uniref:hypothetical protein n=1 Tax=Micromonospora sp. NPDC049559 TaxID=3155923 RepID=UPI0034206A97